MKQEITVIENSELVKIVKGSQIEKTKAEAYAIGYAPFMIQVNELSNALKEMDKENPTDEDAKVARRSRLDLVKLRSAVTEKKKTDKETIVIEGRLIDNLFNVVSNSAKLTESEYLEVEKHQEIKETERKEKLKADRIDLLDPYDVDTTYIALSEMSEEQFVIFLDSQKTAFEAKVEHERLAEVVRVEAEKKAEKDRISAEKLRKANELKQKKENARLKKEADELRKEKEAAAKVQADKDAKDKAERDKLQKENARIAKELADKKEAEELAHEKEKQRIADEEADKIAKAKAVALAPDKDKINALYSAIKSFEFPECKDKDAAALVDEVKEGFQIILKGIIHSAKKLK